jgi:hypothetical protein
MIMAPRLRKFALATHITSAVGWIGAVAGFLALAVVGLTSQDAQTVRAAYLAMELIAWFVIAPLSLASLLTALVMSLGTRWGLFRHYWVVAKLLINVLATIALLMWLPSIDYLAGVAAKTTLSSGDLGGPQTEAVIRAGGASLLLLAATAIAVFKPWGVSRYGQRKQHVKKPGRSQASDIRRSCDGSNTNIRDPARSGRCGRRRRAARSRCRNGAKGAGRDPHR